MARQFSMPSRTHRCQKVRNVGSPGATDYEMLDRKERENAGIFLFCFIFKSEVREEKKNRRTLLFFFFSSFFFFSFRLSVLARHPMPQALADVSSSTWQGRDVAIVFLIGWNQSARRKGGFHIPIYLSTYTHIHFVVVWEMSSSGSPNFYASKRRFLHVKHSWLPRLLQYIAMSPSTLGANTRRWCIFPS